MELSGPVPDVAAIELADCVSRFFLDKTGGIVSTADLYILSQLLYMVPQVFGQEPLFQIYNHERCVCSLPGCCHRAGKDIYQSW
jgi:hypothetical protein